MGQSCYQGLSLRGQGQGQDFFLKAKQGQSQGHVNFFKAKDKTFFRKAKAKDIKFLQG